ncbi:MAG: type IV secretion system DNA-binding domain-containing protein [Rhizomicrobium sp.]
MDFPGPSTYAPFLRRFFGNEKRRELEEAQSLYARMRSQQDGLQEKPEYLNVEVRQEFAQLPYDLYRPMTAALDAVILAEAHIFFLPPLDFERMNMREFVNAKNFLRAKEYFFANKDIVLQKLYGALIRTFCGIADQLPQTETPSPFTIPLIYALPEPRMTIDKIYGTLVEDQYNDRGLFSAVSERMYRNLCEASGRIPYEDSRKPWKYAEGSDLPLDALADQYLKGTPFHELMMTPVPLKLTHEDRFSHMHIVGGTGAGKTTLLENLIAHDLHAPDCPSLIIVDSQGDLIGKLSRLERFHPEHGAFRDRFLLITPKDIERPPALNIFDVNRARLSGYDELTKEQVTAGVIQTFDYLFAGLLGADLTAKQGVFFKFVARLMLALPETLGRNATILDMMALMEDATPYRAAIRSLPDIQRSFFEKDFNSKTFVQTKEQIRYRLQAVIENPAIARLFTSPSTRIDLFEEMNRGSIVLVDTAKDFLKGASSHFGRIFISLVLQAVLERAAIPEHERRPAFLIVDEAASYFDSNIDDLLTEARKYKVGCVFAHQFLDQCTSSLRASLAANTSIKMVSGVSTQDARALAPDLRTTADFVLAQPRLHFAAHIRNVTPQAVSVPVLPGALAREGGLSNVDYDGLRLLNTERVSLPRLPASGLDVVENAATDAEDDIQHSVSDPTAPSREW